MKSLFALGWRFLLAFALVANPLAAALAAPCHEPAAPTATAEKAPPCHHGMAQAQGVAKSAPAGPHAHDCAKAGCDFGSCCASCVLLNVATAPLLHAPMQDIGQAAGARALAGPPLPPLIRPPIA